jgi:hypothetical protein
MTHFLEIGANSKTGITLNSTSTLPLVYGLIKEEIGETDKKTKVKGWKE